MEPCGNARRTSLRPRNEREIKGYPDTGGTVLAKGQSKLLASGIHLRLPPALIARVDRASADEAMTRPEWLRMLIRRELARLKKEAQRARRQNVEALRK